MQGKLSQMKRDPATLWQLWGLCGYLIQGLCGYYGVYEAVTGYMWLLWDLCCYRDYHGCYGVYMELNVNGCHVQPITVTYITKLNCLMWLFLTDRVTREVGDVKCIPLLPVWNIDPKILRLKKKKVMVPPPPPPPRMWRLQNSHPMDYAWCLRCLGMGFTEGVC